MKWKEIPKIFSSPASRDIGILKRVFKSFFEEKRTDYPFSFSELFSYYSDGSPDVDFSILEKLLYANVYAPTSVEELKSNFLEWILVFRELSKLSLQIQYFDSEKNVKNSLQELVYKRKLVLQKLLTKVDAEVSLVKYKDTWVWWDHWLEKSSFFVAQKNLLKGPPQEKKKISDLNFKKYRQIEEEGFVLYPIEVFRWKDEYKKSGDFGWLSVDREIRDPIHYAALGDCTWIPFGQLWHNVRAGWLLLGVAENRLGGVARSRPSFYEELRQIQNVAPLIEEIKKTEQMISDRGIDFIKFKDIFGEIPEFLISLVDSVVSAEFVRSVFPKYGDLESSSVMWKVFLRILLDRVEIFLDVRNIKSGRLHKRSISAGAFSF